MFELAATIALGGVTTIWSQDGYINQACKFAFLALTVWGDFEAAAAFGYTGN